MYVNPQAPSTSRVPRPPPPLPKMLLLQTYITRSAQKFASGYKHSNTLTLRYQVLTSSINLHLLLPLLLGEVANLQHDLPETVLKCNDSVRPGYHPGAIYIYVCIHYIYISLYLYLYVSLSLSLSLSLSYLILSYYIILYYIILYYIILYYIILYYIILILYHIISYHIISYHIILYHIISYHIISHHIISYHIITFLVRLLIATATTPVPSPLTKSPPWIMKSWRTTSALMKSFMHQYITVAFLYISLHVWESFGAYSPTQSVSISSVWVVVFL